MNVTKLRKLNLCTYEEVNGSTVVKRLSLLGRKGGWGLKGWRAKAPALKSSGVFQSGVFSDGRRLVASTFENISEELTLVVHSKQQKTLTLDLRELRRYITKVLDFWESSWNSEPVWLEMLAPGMPNDQYALLYYAELPEDDDYYTGAFSGDDNAAMDDLKLVLERGHWMDQVPASGTATAIGVKTPSTDPDGTTRYFGNVDGAEVYTAVTDGTAYLANQHVINNLTAVYYNGPSGLSGNLLDGPWPSNLLTNPCVIGDAMYFCSEIAGPGNAKGVAFTNLVFELGLSQVNLTLGWEYYAGVIFGWKALTPNDGTNSFQNLGKTTVHWEAPADWAPYPMDLPGSTTGWVVRCRVTNTGGATTAPQQDMKRIYSVTWGFIDLAEDIVDGDLPALARWQITNKAHSAATLNVGPGKVILGLRSLDRGDSFQAFINLANRGNVSGITVTEPAVGAVFVTNGTAPAGQCLDYSVAGLPGAENEGGTITISNTIAQEYRGEYHAYLRMYQIDGAAGDLLFALQVLEGGLSAGAYTTDYVASREPGEDWHLLDLGSIRIGDTQYGDETSFSIGLTIMIKQMVAGPIQAYLYDLILIPADEWACISTVPNHINYHVDEYQTLDVDSIYNPKRPLRSILKTTATGQIYFPWVAIGNGPAQLQTKVAQRLWVLCSENTLFDTDLDRQVASPAIVLGLKLQRAQRYLTLRGDL